MRGFLEQLAQSSHVEFAVGLGSSSRVFLLQANSTFEEPRRAAEKTRQRLDIVREVPEMQNLASALYAQALNPKP